MLFSDHQTNLDSACDAAAQGCASLLEQLLRLKKIPASYYCPERNRSLLELATQHGHLGAVDVLLHFGADINARHAQALLFAVSGGHRQIAERLLEQGADLTLIPEILSIAIHHRAGYHMYHILMQAGARVDYPLSHSQFPDTPLVTAIKTRDVRLVKLLIASGASLNRDNHVTGDYPLLNAIEESNEQLGLLLIEHGGALKKYEEWFAMLVFTPFLVIPYLTESFSLTLFKQGFFHPDSYNAQGETLLHQEARAGNLEQVKHLLALGANPNRPRFADKITPLSLAIEQGHATIVKAFLAAPLAPWAQLHAVETALRHKKEEILSLLLSHRPIKTLVFRRITIQPQQAQPAGREHPPAPIIFHNQARLPDRLQYRSRQSP